jgi:hypothetical protein
VVALPSAASSTAVVAALRVVMACPDFLSDEVTGADGRVDGAFGEWRPGPGE